jgi:hypothetical protein
MRKILAVLLLAGACAGAFGQSFTLSGSITDDKKNVLPFTSILVKGTGTGTNSNADGAYSLRLAPGSYEIVFQYVGYRKEVRKVELNSDTKLDIVMRSEAYELKEVVVKDGEDPAYAVIRQAIKKRKYYLGLVNAYTCKAYIKGLQRLKDIPKSFGKLLKVTANGEGLDSSMLGVIYLSESESKYHYRKPNDEKEIMYSSKVSGDNKAFSFNQLSDMKFNFYENLVYIDALSDRPFISPISETALLSYRYHLLGTLFEDGKMINKIEVLPKRRTDPCFHGIIYIQENTWRIHSADMYLTKDAKIDFVDTLAIRQVHAPVKGDSIWMPVGMNFTFYFKFLGFKGDGYYNAVISDYEINPAFPKKFFRNEVLKVEEEANKKDSSYWKDNRPIPLTQEEVDDYRKKDSLERRKGTKEYKDSVDRRANRFRFSSLLTGYHYQNTYRKLNFSASGIVNSGVQYNTVEGVNAGINLSFNKEYDDFREYNIGGTVHYGFANMLWGGSLNADYLQRPEKFRHLTVRFQSMVQQFNAANPISPLVNTAYTLLLNDNYMKLYRKSAAGFVFRQELVNGLMFYGGAEYALRDPLVNRSPYLIIDDTSRYFTSNNPLRPSADSLSFSSNSALTLEVNFRIRFRQKYYTLPHRKINTGSKYPNLWLSYRKAVPALGATADYDLAFASVEDDIRLGLLGTFAYRLKGGYFLTNRNMFFMDYRHFNGNQTLIATGDYLNSFKMLPYYTYSTQKYYAEAHVEHHFNGFIINKIPLLKRTRLQEVAGFHGLYNDKLSNYYELNFGIENIFKVMRIDYVLSYGIGGKVSNGFLIGFSTQF